MTLRLAIKRAIGAAEKLPVVELPTQKSLDEEPPSIEGLIDEVLSLETRRLKFFRPSMLDGCDRQNVFHYMNAPSHPQRQNPRLKRILDNGTYTHSRLQKYLGDHWNWWFAPEARVMVEVRGALIRGSCDGVLIRRTDRFAVGCEFKSVNHTEFLKLAKPKPEHVKQASLYMNLQQLPYIIVVYEDKDKQHIKEYAVKYNPGAWKEKRARIRYLHQYVEEGKLPEFDKNTCNPVFCGFVDYCRKKGAPV